MKSPDELIATLKRQWHNPALREQRLLKSNAWPLRLAIGKPSAQWVEKPDQIRAHVQAWRAVSFGTVQWEQISYRSTGTAVAVPSEWRLENPSEWIAATYDPNILASYQRMAQIVSSVSPMFHSLIVRQQSLLAEKPVAEVIQACELAMQLSPGCAQGAPLRALPSTGVDSKFFERHRSLMIKLLDIRFDGLVSELGLEGFLGALSENDHWLLVADLEGNQLPYKQIRVRDKDLAANPLPAKRILLVENERCVHQLPALTDTVAVLGAGLNLVWLGAAWLGEKQIAYWGDIDTWGFTMLARARLLQPKLAALLMTEAVFEQFGNISAVPEPKTASSQPPLGLTEQEIRLYFRLLSEEKGRLEQEFISKSVVEEAVLGWDEG